MSHWSHLMVQLADKTGRLLITHVWSQNSIKLDWICKTQHFSFFLRCTS